MKMAPRLLLLCLLGCVQLVLGAPINQLKDVVGLQKDYFEREEPFRLTAGKLLKCWEVRAVREPRMIKSYVSSRR